MGNLLNSSDLIIFNFLIEDFNAMIFNGIKNKKLIYNPEISENNPFKPLYFEELKEYDQGTLRKLNDSYIQRYIFIYKYFKIDDHDIS